MGRGPSPVKSKECGFRYYICFVDDFSRFSWIHSLHTKDEAQGAFKLFKNMVDKKIKIFKVIGEVNITLYRVYEMNLSGIIFWYPCPHVASNGRVERKHGHIAETGLSLLAQVRCGKFLLESIFYIWLSILY